jgi:hypothetical protein
MGSSSKAGTNAGTNAGANGGTNTGANGAGSVRLRNVRRSQWFLRFPVSAEVASVAEGVPGVAIERDGSWRRDGHDVPTAVCTIALGDAEGHPSELAAEIEIPRAVWEACLAEPSTGPTVRGLITDGEIATYAPTG